MPERRLRSFLYKLLGDRVFWDFPTARLTTIGAGGPAWALARPEGAEEVAKIALECAAAQMPYMVIGYGSNLLFSDEGYRGLLIKLRPGFKEFYISESGHLTAGAGAKVVKIASAGLATGFSGFECLSGIPCSLGGALMMNAGSGGGTVSDCLLKIDYMKADGTRGSVRKDELTIEYRRLGGLPRGAIILGAEFQLVKAAPSDIKARLDALTEQRKAAQPQGVRSAGCFFKNPQGHSAGRLIDQCGLKGLSIGGAMVSDVHANFLINTGGATAEDFLSLAALITDRVQKKHGLLLEPEVRIIKTSTEEKNA